MGIISIAIAVATVLFGYVQSRYFVRNKLRYVDSVQKGTAPLIAGAVAALVAWPIVAILPLVGIGTAILFGASVGLGVAAGAKDVRRINAGLLEP
jgi:hypothetical protein